MCLSFNFDSPCCNATFAAVSLVLTPASVWQICSDDVHLSNFGLEASMISMIISMIASMTTMEDSWKFEALEAWSVA